MKVIIEGKIFDHETFYKWIKDDPIDKASSWLQEIKNFAEEWHNENDFINVHTSGSTGNPKWIKHSKSSVIKSAQLTVNYFNLNKDDKIVLCLPLRFIAGKLMYIRAIVANLQVNIIVPTANPFAKLNEPIDFIAVTPHQLTIGLKESPKKIALVKQILIGGGPISQELLEKIKLLNSQCFHSYGMTETITHVAIKVLNGTKASNVFSALPGVHFQVDENDALIINAKHLDEARQETNDIVSLVSSTSFKWLGRKDHVINSGGIKLNPEQIEQKITSIIPSAFLIGSEKNDTFGEQIILLVEGDNEVIHGLQAKLEIHLSSIEMPKALYSVKQFFRTENGKLKRKEILSQFFKTKLK